jgi:hypothetical protein
MSWGPSYWLPTEKWMPIYWPNYDYETRQPPFQPFTLPVPPNGDYSNLPWWKNPDKTTWPYQPVPWEPKILGAFSARKVTMWPENLVKYPPFGNIKVKTPTDHPHSIGSIKVHMPPKPWLDISPHPSLWAEEKLKGALQEMSRKRPIKLITDEGSITIKAIRSANWSRPKEDIKGRRVRVFRPKTTSGNPDLFA